MKDDPEKLAAQRLKEAELAQKLSALSPYSK